MESEREQHIDISDEYMSMSLDELTAQLNAANTRVQQLTNMIDTANTSNPDIIYIDREVNERVNLLIEIQQIEAAIQAKGKI